MSRIAKIAVPISLDREFDYSFLPTQPVKQGSRVLVDFNRRKRVGIVTEVSSKSLIKKIKPIIKSLDVEPVLDSAHMQFAQKLSAVYPYSRGDFLFMMLPAHLKKPKTFNFKKPEVDKIK